VENSSKPKYVELDNLKKRKRLPLKLIHPWQALAIFQMRKSFAFYYTERNNSRLFNPIINILILRFRKIIISRSCWNGKSYCPTKPALKPLLEIDQETCGIYLIE
jgi:hypothetical protein